MTSVDECMQARIKHTCSFYLTRRLWPNIGGVGTTECFMGSLPWDALGAISSKLIILLCLLPLDRGSVNAATQKQSATVTTDDDDARRDVNGWKIEVGGCMGEGKPQGCGFESVARRKHRKNAKVNENVGKAAKYGPNFWVIFLYFTNSR